MASNNVVECVSRRIEVRCFIDWVTDVCLAWMTSGRVSIREMQRFEETECCIIDGRDHLLKGLAVFGVSYDWVQLQRCDTKEVQQKGDKKARIGRNLHVEIFFWSLRVW